MLRRGEYPLIPGPLLPRCGREGEKKNSPLCHFGGEAAKMTQSQQIPRPWGRGQGWGKGPLRNMSNLLWRRIGRVNEKILIL